MEAIVAPASGGREADVTTSAATKIQAAFRSRRCRDLHVERVRRGLPWSPFVPAKMEAVRAMLALAQLQPGDTLVDVGSGDGRVIVSAAVATPSLRQAIGVEIDGALVAQSRRQIDGLGLNRRVRVIHDDWLHVDLSGVDVVVLFFLPHAEIATLLQQKLRAGTRVVTYVFQIAQWQPECVEETVPFMTARGSSSIYRYRVPPMEL